MRAISLWQPWASACVTLAADGRAIKCFETRHWSTRYRGPLVIHAAKRWTLDAQEFLHDEMEGYARLLGEPIPPLGAIVGIVDMVSCHTTDSLMTNGLVSAREMDWGNFGPGRFAWGFVNPRRLHEPIPWRRSVVFLGS